MKSFPRQKMIAMANDEKRKHSVAKICYSCGEKFNKNSKKF